jgi:hypothetical protein
MDLGRCGGIYACFQAHNRGRHDDILQTVNNAPPLTIPQATDEAVAALPAAEIREPASSTEVMAKYSARLAALTGKGVAL